MQKRVKITSGNRITVPGEVLLALGVQAGDHLVFDIVGRDVRVRTMKAKSSFSRYRSIGNPRIGSGRKNINSWLQDLRGQ